MPIEMTFYPQGPLRQGTQQGALPGTDLGTVSVAIGASASAATAVPAGCGYVVATTSEACRIKFGNASTVAAEKSGAGISRLLKADAEYAFLVQPGQFVSVIQAA